MIWRLPLQRRDCHSKWTLPLGEHRPLSSEFIQLRRLVTWLRDHPQEGVSTLSYAKEVGGIITFPSQSSNPLCSSSGAAMWFCWVTFSFGVRTQEGITFPFSLSFFLDASQSLSMLFCYFGLFHFFLCSSPPHHVASCSPYGWPPCWPTHFSVFWQLPSFTSCQLWGFSFSL